MPVIKNCKSVMFAENTKCYHTINISNDSNNLQKYLNSLIEWSWVTKPSFQPSECVN